jgi:UDP-glucose-4-epimerase GalE
MRPLPTDSHFVVTGGAGYIGSHAAMRLLDLGHRVTVLDSLARGHRGAVAALAAAGAGRFRFEETDLRDTARVSEILQAAPVDAVLHFAALAYVGESVEEPLAYYACNTGGGLSLLVAMREAGVRRIIFSSTCATYGEPDAAHIPISEGVPQRPINPYGRSKLHFEEILRDEAARPSVESARCGDAPLGAVALRYFNVAGCDARGRLGEDHRPESHLIPIALEVALGKRDGMRIFGEDYPTPDGTCIRDYVHVEDLVDAHVAALGAIEPGRVRAWNIGIGRGYSVREVLEACRRVTGHPIPAAIAPRRAGDPPVLFADATAARRELGFAPRWTDLDETVRSAWTWMRAHPSGYAD